MIDLDGLPVIFLAKRKYSEPEQSETVLRSPRKSIGADIEDPRFAPYLQLHEYETLLYSDPYAFTVSFDECDGAIPGLKEIAAQFKDIERINDNEPTAPSKRIIGRSDAYGGMKPTAGPDIAEYIGLAKLRELCSHFSDWIGRLEAKENRVMAKRRSSKQKTLVNEPVPLRFDQKLVLNQWMLGLFEVKEFDKSPTRKQAELEGLDEDNVHKFFGPMGVPRDYQGFPADTLLGYHQNIVRHTLRLNQRREQPIRWKYSQWLTLLFTEVYLDRFFRDPDKLIAQLNASIERFNADVAEKEQIPSYYLGDLRKVAFWNATGSGKTLLMHANILQYLHYLKLHGRERELTTNHPAHAERRALVSTFA